MQELRQAIESLRDHVQIVWQAVDEVREVIEQVIGRDAAEFWQVEPPDGFPLGRFRPFAGYEPYAEWQAEQDEASSEEPTSNPDNGAGTELPAELLKHVQSAVAARLRESHAEDVVSLADTHRHNGHDAIETPATAGPAQQRSLWDGPPPADAPQQMVLTAETPQKEAEPVAAAVEVAAEVKPASAEVPEPKYFAPISGQELRTLMQRHKMTIGELATRAGITQKRIREAREDGLADPNAVRDWLQAIIGRDPGPVGARPPAESYTLDDWIEFRHRVSDGAVDAAGIKKEFQRMKAGRQHFIEQLMKSKTAEQLRLMAMQAGSFDASRNTKQHNAEAIYRTHLSAFTLGESVCYNPMEETHEEALERIVFALTDEAIAAQREKSRQEREAREKALTNPETYQEFSQFVSRKGTDALSDEQLATWDRMHADISRNTRKQKQTVEQFQSAELEDIEFRIIEGFHDREQVPLWIVQLQSRVERATFNELKVKASQLGGWWSSFKKDAAGFQFRSKESAEKFAGLTNGSADRSAELLARKLRKMDSASERLATVAETLDEGAAAVLAADADKLKNTARRADMAASARADAYRDQADAKTLRSLAAALAEGKATYLDGVWNAAQIRMLVSLQRQSRRTRIERQLREEGIERARHRWSLRYEELESQPLSAADARYAVFPKPRLYRPHLVQAFAKLAATPGAKQVTAKMQKLVASRPKEEEFIEFLNEHQVELLQDFLGRAKAAGYDCWWFDHCLDDYKRLRSAHIYDNHELRCALRELVPHLATTAGDDPVTRAEDELRGKDLPGFYPTPRPLIERMLDDAEIEPTHTVLEPSAGKGDIIDGIRRRCPEAKLTAIERNLTLQGILTAKGYSDIVSYGDFLEHRGEYDRVLMNPPFEAGQDIEHVRHAYDLLAPGGRLVAIMSEGPFFRSDAKSTGFREWLSTIDGEYDAALPDDTFKGAEAFRQTGVKTRYVILTKPS